MSPQPVPNLKERLNTLDSKRLIELLMESDKYKVAQYKGLRSLFSFLINEYFSSEVMVTIKADTSYQEVISMTLAKFVWSYH